MRAPPSRPLLSGCWSCLTLKFLSHQLNFCFSWLQFNTLLLSGVEQTLVCYLSLLGKLSHYSGY